MFFWGYDEDGKKKYYNTNSNKITMTPVYDEAPLSETIVFPTAEKQLKNYGYTDAEVLEIQKRLKDANSINSTVSETSTNPNGSLVSNSAQSLKNTALYQKASLQIEKNKLDAMNSSNEIKKKQLDLMDYNLTMQGQIYSQLFELNEALKALTTATKEQKFVGGDTSVHIDTSKLTEANTKIAQGVENQIATNAKLVENLTKKNEHLDYLKNGSDSLKNSKGDVIKPREVSALNDAEQHIDIKSLNTFDSQHFIDSIQASENTNEEDILKIEELLKKFTLFDKTKFETELNQNLFVKGGLNG